MRRRWDTSSQAASCCRRTVGSSGTRSRLRSSSSRPSASSEPAISRRRKSGCRCCQARVRDLVDSAAVTHLRAELYTTLDRTDRAVEAGPRIPPAHRRQLVAAPDQGRKCGRNMSRFGDSLRSRPIEALVDLPPMTDPAYRATLDVLTVLEEPAHFTDENLRCLAVARMVNLSLKYGNSDGSCPRRCRPRLVCDTAFRRLPARVPLRQARS